MEENSRIKEKSRIEGKTSMEEKREVHYQKLPKQALYCMYASGILTGVILMAVIVGVDYFWIYLENIEVGKWISLLLVLLLLAEVIISPWFRYHRYRYSINEECIDIIEGYLFVKRNIVPIERLHKLQTARGPFDQMFHVAKVIVTTGGGDVTISFLEENEAEKIAENLRRRINEIVIRQREDYGEQN